MDYQGYLTARNALQTLAEPVTALLLACALTLIIGAFFRFENRRPGANRLLAAITAGALFIGFALLAWYHWKINRALPLIEPFSGQELGRYYLPIWIEGEKLYFWAVVFALLAYLVNRRRPAFGPAANLGLALLVGLSLLTSNPFTDPLPGFHEEISSYVATMGLDAASSGTPAVTQAAAQNQAAVFGQTYGKMVGFYNSSYMWIHPPLIFLSYAALALSFVGSLFMLRGRRPETDELAYGYARLGYLALTVGLLFSYPWALSAWKDQPWWWDPKINMSLMMWVLYGAYLHARLYLHRRGMWTTTAVLGVVCFAALVITYLSSYLIPGIHSVA